MRLAGDMITQTFLIEEIFIVLTKLH